MSWVMRWVKPLTVHSDRICDCYEFLSMSLLLIDFFYDGLVSKMLSIESYTQFQSTDVTLTLLLLSSYRALSIQCSRVPMAFSLGARIGECGCGLIN